MNKKIIGLPIESWEEYEQNYIGGYRQIVRGYTGEYVNELQRRIDKAIEYIDKEVKGMPNNGCSIRLKEIRSILE